MTAQRIINCCLRYPRSRSTVTTIELMVGTSEGSERKTHPAVPHEDCAEWGCGIGCDAFSQSEDRVHEHSVLVDANIRQNILDKGIRLCSYATSHIGKSKREEKREMKSEKNCESNCESNHELNQQSKTESKTESNCESKTESNCESKTESKSMLGNGKRIVMMLSLKEGTGNTITGTRIASVLMELGFVVQMVDTTDHFESQNLAAILHNQRYNEGSTLYRLFCIHALRAGVFALTADVPYVLMLGGTDINVSIHDPTKIDRVKNVLQHAHHIIAFTESMKQRTIDLLSDSIAPPITVIPQVVFSIQNTILQSTEIPHSPDASLRTALRLTASHQLLVLPSGLRPVFFSHPIKQRLRTCSSCWTRSRSTTNFILTLCSALSDPFSMRSMPTPSLRASPTRI